MGGNQNGRFAQSVFLIHETRPAFRTFRSKRQMHTAVFLAPKAGPESVIEPQALVGPIVLECWVAARITLNVE